MAQKNNGITSFGVFKEAQTSGDYIRNKKAKTTYCNPNVCVPNKIVDSQGQLLLLRTANHLKFYNCNDLYNKTNLNVNLITQLNLIDVPVIQSQHTMDCPTTLGVQTAADASGVIIDPCGNLFGYNTCSINNYTRYMEYYPNSPFVPIPPIPPIPPDYCVWTNPFGKGIDIIDPDISTGQLPVIFDSNNNLYVGGYFSNVGEIPANSIAKWNSTSGWSSPFNKSNIDEAGPGLIGYCNCLAFDSTNENLYIGGSFTINNFNAQNIVKWNVSTEEFIGIGDPLSYIVTAIIVEGDTVYVCGYLNDKAYIQKWNNGWTNVDIGEYDHALFLSMAIVDTNLYIGGHFDTINNISANNIAKFNIINSIWTPIGLGLTGSGTLGQARAQNMLYNPNDLCLYVCGQFNTAGTITAKGMAKWNTSIEEWSLIGPGIKDTSEIFGVNICINVNKIYIACVFITQPGNIFEFEIAEWTGSAWVYSCTCDSFISNLTVHNYKIYTTGIFTSAGDILANRIAIWEPPVLHLSSFSAQLFAQLSAQLSATLITPQNGRFHQRKVTVPSMRKGVNTEQQKELNIKRDYYRESICEEDKQLYYMQETIANRFTKRTTL